MPSMWTLNHSIVVITRVGIWRAQCTRRRLWSSDVREDSWNPDMERRRVFIPQLSSDTRAPSILHKLCSCPIEPADTGAIRVMTGTRERDGKYSFFMCERD